MSQAGLRIAVTGASGFVGGWLCRHLRQAVPEMEVVPLAGDIRDRAVVAEAVRAARPDAVVHLAAVAAPAEARDDPVLAWEVNVMGTLHLAEAMKAHVPDAFLLHISSSEVYGDSFRKATGPLGEEAALRPRSTYGATKAAADLMVGQMAVDGLHAVRLRPFNHTGPGQAETYVVSAFARQIARIEKGLQPPQLAVGNLEAERDMLDVRDIVAAYAAAIARRETIRPGCALNLATGRPVRIGVLLEVLLAEARVAIKVVPDPLRMRPDDLPRISGDASKAVSVLDWRPERELAGTLGDVLAYWRQA